MRRLARIVSELTAHLKTYKRDFVPKNGNAALFIIAVAPDLQLTLDLKEGENHYTFYAAGERVTALDCMVHKAPAEGVPMLLRCNEEGFLSMIKLGWEAFFVRKFLNESFFRAMAEILVPDVSPAQSYSVVIPECLQVQEDAGRITSFVHPEDEDVLVCSRQIIAVAESLGCSLLYEEAMGELPGQRIRKLIIARR